MKKIIVANWKMNPASLKQAEQLFDAVKKTNAIICMPLVYLSLFNYKQLGAQDLFWEESGAYTGEVSGKMLKDLGCTYVIIGHSERRKYFKETDEIVNKKLKAALKVGLIPILCIRNKKDLKRIENRKLKIENLIIAYEPVWAIGTGNFCSADKANKVREFIKKKVDAKILYGGSVNSKIAADYIKIGFDGLLVGGASLNSKEFIKIVKQVV